MTATERAQVALDLLRQHPDGMTYAEFRRGLLGKLTGREASDALARFFRDRVLTSEGAGAAKVYKLKPNAADYTPKPRGSFT